jgi:WXG100 family type VII secretion target
MAEAFSVDPEALSGALERMEAFSKLAKALLDEIDATVKNLHVSWDGVGASAHAEAHRHWTHGAAQMDQALAVLHRSGTGAHRNYTRAAAANRGMWS